MKTTYTRKESKKQKLKSPIYVKSKFLFDSIAVLLIILSPFIIYVYTIIPNKEAIETPFFTLTKNGFSSIIVAVWIYVSKIVPLYLFILWFITCKHWWYHAILIPIAMYAFQFFTAINNDSSIMDENEIIWLIPVVMVVTPIVYLIRIKLFDKLVYGIDLKEIERELDEYKQREREEKKEKEAARKKRLSDIH
ncbi:hypothetical protein [Leptobacterium sp. I13]|uniref:hypothetical protein n=1 Tax=Leptobacterium meishanense TaxID=3128904 RepID=UPI0030EBDDC6